nr:hypothetical protein [Lachnospiraceae bacterium]
MKFLKKIGKTIQPYITTIVMCIITMVVLYLLVQNNGDGYVYQQYPSFPEESITSLPIQGTTFEQTVDFEAHDIQYLALRFDVDHTTGEDSGSEIQISLLMDSEPLGIWTVKSSQIQNIYHYYIPIDLHNIPSGNLTMEILATGDEPIGLFVGDTAGKKTADYILVFDSYSRFKLLLLAFGITILLFLLYALLCKGKSAERIFVFLYISLGILYFLVCPIL